MVNIQWAKYGIRPLAVAWVDAQASVSIVKSVEWKDNAAKSRKYAPTISSSADGSRYSVVVHADSQAIYHGSSWREGVFKEERFVINESRRGASGNGGDQES